MPVDLSFSLASPVVGGSVILPDKLGESLRQRMPLHFQVPQMPLAETAAMMIARVGKQFGKRLLL